MTWTEQVEQYIREGKTVSGAKGDSTLQASMKGSADFMKTLTESFKQRFAGQTSILNNLDNVFTHLIQNPQGFSPTLLAGLQTNNSEAVAKDYAHAKEAYQETVAARNGGQGGNGLPSGVDAQIQAQIASGAAQEEAAGTRQIGIANEQERNKNYWSALAGEEGVGHEEDPLGFGNEVNSSANSTADLGQAYQASKQSGLLSALGGVVGGVGSAVGGYFTGKGKN